MNTEHQRLCSSREWEEHLHATVLPAVTAGVALGEEMLELGPGPAAATDWLRTWVRRLVVVEREEQSVNALRTRFGRTESRSSAAMPRRFRSPPARSIRWPRSPCFTTSVLDCFRHEFWVRRSAFCAPVACLSGGTEFTATSFTASIDEDSYNPIEPATLLAWLGGLGYVRITIGLDETLTFVAHKPKVDPDHPRTEE